MGTCHALCSTRLFIFGLYASSQQSLRGDSVYWFGVVNVADGVPVSTVVVGLGFHLIHFRR